MSKEFQAEPFCRAVNLNSKPAPRSVRSDRFQFSKLCAKRPVSDAAAALVLTLCSLYCAFGAPCAKNDNALLKVLVWATVDAEQNLEKDHSIAAHGNSYLRPHRRQWVG